MNHLKRVAALDIDRCTTHGPTNIHGVEGLVQVGALTEHADLLAEIDAFNDPAAEGGLLKYIRAMNKVFHLLTADVPPHLMAEATELVAERWDNDTYDEMRPRIEEAKEEGPLIIISDGPHDFIEAFGRKIGAAVAIGKSNAEYEADAAGNKGSMGNKWAKLGRAAASLRLEFGVNAELHRAFGDANADLPVLEMARHPVVVNPMNDEMVAYGRLPGWETLNCQKLLEWGDLSGRLIRQ